jgi:hypothetical protein
MSFFIPDSPEESGLDSYLEDRAIQILDDENELGRYLELYNRPLQAEPWDDAQFMSWLDDRLIDELNDSKLGYLQAKEDDND